MVVARWHFRSLDSWILVIVPLSYSNFLRTFDCGFTLYQTIKQTAIKQQDANKAKPESKTKQASCHQGNRIDGFPDKRNNIIAP
jgi:hypothetical protein